MTIDHSRLPDSSLCIGPDHEEYDAIFEYLRRQRRQKSEAKRLGIDRRTEWIWRVPETLRMGLLNLIEDAVSLERARLDTALSSVLYRNLASEMTGDPDDEDTPWTDEQKLASFSKPTTVGAVLLAISDELKIDPRRWLNKHDLELMRHATYPS
jgi:hypothetical protein